MVCALILPDMSLVSWNDSYSVHVHEMDNQHKRLFELINQLHDAMLAGKGNETMDSILRGLKEYTITHFSAEEKYMEQFKYIGLVEQKREHASFIKKIEEYEKQLKDRKLGLSIDVMNYLKDWLIHHIQSVDSRYGETFQQHGLNK